MISWQDLHSSLWLVAPRFPLLQGEYRKQAWGDAGRDSLVHWWTCHLICLRDLSVAFECNFQEGLKVSSTYLMYTIFCLWYFGNREPRSRTHKVETMICFLCFEVETTHWLEIKPESCKPVNMTEYERCAEQNGSCETTMSCRKPGKNVASPCGDKSVEKVWVSKSGHVWWEPVKWVELWELRHVRLDLQYQQGTLVYQRVDANKRFSWWKYHLHSVFTSHFTTHCQCQGQRGWYCKQRCEPQLDVWLILGKWARLRARLRGQGEWLFIPPFLSARWCDGNHKSAQRQRTL